MTRSIQSGGTVLLVMVARDFVCQKQYAFLLRPQKVNPINSVLRVLPSCFVLNFCGFRKSRQYFLLLLRYPMGFDGVKNTVCLWSHDLFALLR